jgi:hypothetical protein
LTVCVTLFITAVLGRCGARECVPARGSRIIATSPWSWSIFRSHRRVSHVFVFIQWVSCPLCMVSIFFSRLLAAHLIGQRPYPKPTLLSLPLLLLCSVVDFTLGILAVVTSDCEAPFTASLWVAVCQLLGVPHSQMTAYHPHKAC